MTPPTLAIVAAVLTAWDTSLERKYRRSANDAGSKQDHHDPNKRRPIEYPHNHCSLCLCHPRCLEVDQGAPWRVPRLMDIIAYGSGVLMMIGSGCVTMTGGG